MTITRRHALHLSLGALATMGACAQHKLQARDPGDSDSQRKNIKIDETTFLKEVATNRGLIYGSVGRYPDLTTDEEFADLFAQECTMLVNGNALKWKYVHPQPDRYDFAKGDELAAFARNNGMLFRGHTLIWSQALPNWFREQANRKNAEQLMTEHVQSVVKHYAGQMHSWDVANECVFPGHERNDGLRKSIWLRLLGKDYIELAFRAAAEADPQALLVYNDNRMHSDTEDGEATRTAVLKLLERLLAKGTPVHALGMQAHLWAKDEMPLNPQKITAFVREVADLGLKIVVSEMDVKDKHLPTDTQERDRLIADAYRTYLDAVLQEPAVTTVVTWGISDRYSWRNKPKFGGNRPDGTLVRPLPRDRDLQRKPAWYAIAQAFNNAPAR